VGGVQIIVYITWSTECNGVINRGVSTREQCKRAVANADSTGRMRRDTRNDFEIGPTESLSMSSRNRGTTSTIVIKLGTTFFFIQQCSNGMTLWLLRFCPVCVVCVVVMVRITRDIFDRPRNDPPAPPFDAL